MTTITVPDTFPRCRRLLIMLPRIWLPWNLFDCFPQFFARDSLISHAHDEHKSKSKYNATQGKSTLGGTCHISVGPCRTFTPHPLGDFSWEFLRRFFFLFFRTGASWPTCAAQHIAWTGRNNTRNTSFWIDSVQYSYKTYVYVHRSGLNTLFCLFAEHCCADDKNTVFYMTGTPYCSQLMN